jgi:DNA-binding IscR family transcriptional regulator
MDNSRAQIKAVFGSEYRLAVLYAIAEADPGEIYLTRIAELSGAPQNRVSADLHKLADSGLLTSVEKTEGTQLARYQRAESKLWQVVGDLAPGWGVELRK